MMGASHINTDTANRKLSNARQGFRRFGFKLLVAGSIVALALGVWVADIILVQHNFHTVSPGLVYRSGQVDAAGLARMVQDHGIKSILNLRGGARNGVAEWYIAETNTAQELGVRYYDYELSASHELTDAEMEKLVKIIGNAPKPLLIHCKSGADRSGLVGALYLYSLEGKSAETADRELDLLHGHVPYLFWQDTIAMDRSFWHYVSKHAPSSGVGSRKVSPPLTKQETAPTAGTAN